MVHWTGMAWGERMRTHDPAVEQWLEENTLECPRGLGRMTPQQCERLRARVSLRDYWHNRHGGARSILVGAGDMGKEVVFQPGVCEGCPGIEALHGMEMKKMEETKQCRRCGETKALTAFSRRRSSQDGYDRICKACSDAYVRNRRTRRPSAPGTSGGRREAEPHGMRVCRVCGQAKPFRDLVSNKQCRDGYEPLCKACRRERIRQRKGDGRDGGTSAAADPGERPAGGGAQPCAPSASSIVQVDFHLYPDVLEQIKNLAVSEVRTVELQVLYLVRRGLGTYRGTHGIS